MDLDVTVWYTVNLQRVNPAVDRFEPVLSSQVAHLSLQSFAVIPKFSLGVFSSWHLYIGDTGKKTPHNSIENTVIVRMEVSRETTTILIFTSSII